MRARRGEWKARRKRMRVQAEVGRTAEDVASDAVGGAWATATALSKAHTDVLTRTLQESDLDGVLTCLAKGVTEAIIVGFGQQPPSRDHIAAAGVGIDTALALARKQVLDCNLALDGPTGAAEPLLPGSIFGDHGPTYPTQPKMVALVRGKGETLAAWDTGHVYSLRHNADTWVKVASVPNPEFAADHHNAPTKGAPEGIFAGMAAPEEE